MERHQHATGHTSTLNDFLTENNAAFIRKSASRPEPAPKTCTVCSTTFTRKPTESRSTYRTRTTCSVACVQKEPVRKPSPPKHDRPARLPRPRPLPMPQRKCSVCAALLVPKEGESDRRFAARVTCGHACAAHLRWKIRRGEVPGARRQRVTDEEIDHRAEIILARMAAWGAPESPTTQ